MRNIKPIKARYSLKEDVTLHKHVGLGNDALCFCCDEIGEIFLPKTSFINTPWMAKG